MSRVVRELLSRRLLFVTGKGGVGKSSVAAALGVLAARRGIDTVVVEVGRDRALAGLLQGDRPLEPGDGRTPVPVSPHLFTLHLEPEAALTEYLELQLRVRQLVRLVVGNPGFRRLLDAAPGWRELITLGKLWHLESQRDGAEPRWGLLIVDAPSTGHGLSLLSVPHVVLDTVRLGPLRRHTDWVQGLIQDRARTLVLPVTLPEELPVKETFELCASIRELGIGLGPLLANAVEPVPELPELGTLLAALEGAELANLPDGAALCSIVEHVVRRARLQRGFLDELARESEEPLVELPQLVEGVGTRAQVERFADALEAALAAAEVEA